MQVESKENELYKVRWTYQNLAPIWLPHWPVWRWTISRTERVDDMMYYTEREGEKSERWKEWRIENRLKAYEGGDGSSIAETF